MAVEESQVIQLKKDFNKDGFPKVLFILSILFVVIILLVLTSIYLFIDKPAPVKFSTDNEWRIVKPVPVEQPYLSQADLIQWVSGVLPGLFNCDFINYKIQIEKNAHYFTENGWKKFLVLLNSYAASTTVENSKLFVNANAEGAPYILNRGLLDGKYSWWVQMPININYSGGYSQALDLQVLVVRVSTLDNLYGVAIENILTPAGDKSGNKVLSS